jgi:hypothetical protein
MDLVFFVSREEVWKVPFMRVQAVPHLIAV